MLAICFESKDFGHYPSPQPLEDDDRNAVAASRAMSEDKMSAEPDDVIELLTRDHQVLRGLLDQLDIENDSLQLGSLFMQIVRQLAAHEAAEQEVVFPALRSAVPGQKQEVVHRLGEHEEINELLAEMRVLTPDDPGFEKRASALRLELETHFAVEEEDVFPLLAASVSRKELVALSERVLAVKRTAPAFPEPEFTEHVHAVRGPRRVRD